MGIHGMHSGVLHGGLGDVVHLGEVRPCWGAAWWVEILFGENAVRVVQVGSRR